MKVASEKTAAKKRTGGRERVVSAVSEQNEERGVEPFIVSEGIGMLAAYMSIEDVEIRQSIKQMVEKIAFQSR